ncbi:MAG TPA: flagellar biosynthesis anti-sigma factor FlgM [Terriglobales bacterium]|nr:flagellar biosynthesis anti-sigma factor FlgM [Terriglobales bacterium]
MKITNTPINPTVVTTPSPASARRGAAGASGTTVAAGGDQSRDQLSLGASAVGLTARVLAQPDVRGALVAHFRGQIAAGAYQPDAAQTAGRMLADPLTGL